MTFDPLVKLRLKALEQFPVDYFQFYHSVASVYSSKIEGEEVDFDSYYKHRFLGVKYQPDYTRRADDLYEAYAFILNHPLSLKNLMEAHRILSAHLLPATQRGRMRNTPMYVLSENDRIEYVACDPGEVKPELTKLFDDISFLLNTSLEMKDIFYYAAFVHLIFVKIHPLQDGNGRAARLLEKWFLKEKLGNDAFSIELEKNYHTNRLAYYANIRALGIEYDALDYSKSLDFLQMTIDSLNAF